jgi:hypothetical protein
MSESIAATNKFRVADNANGVITFVPIAGFLSHDDALNLAAWLVKFADPSGERFQMMRNSLPD